MDKVYRKRFKSSLACLKNQVRTQSKFQEISPNLQKIWNPITQGWLLPIYVCYDENRISVEANLLISLLLNSELFIHICNENALCGWYSS